MSITCNRRTVNTPCRVRRMATESIKRVYLTFYAYKQCIAVFYCIAAVCNLIQKERQPTVIRFDVCLQVAIKRLFCFRATETDYTKHTHMYTCVYVPLAYVARHSTARAHAQAIYYSMTQSPYAISSQCAWCYDVYACIFICHTVRVRGHDRNVRETIKSQQHCACVHAFR